MTLEARQEKVKDWNFPKMHMLVHSFDHIKEKGASRNYNTKPNEKLHGPLKKSFAKKTNFKNVASQVRRNNLFYHVILLYRLIDLKI